MRFLAVPGCGEEQTCSWYILPAANLSKKPETRPFRTSPAKFYLVGPNKTRKHFWLGDGKHFSQLLGEVFACPYPCSMVLHWQLASFVQCWRCALERTGRRKGRWFIWFCSGDSMMSLKDSFEGKDYWPFFKFIILFFWSSFCVFCIVLSFSLSLCLVGI